MNEVFESGKILFFDFVIVTLLSLIIGLEQHRHREDQEDEADMLFGTDRTFTFIGILGFILYILNPGEKILFIGGGLVLALLMSVYYYQKIQQQKNYGLTSILSAFITYCLAPLVITQQQGLTLLIVVTVLILTEMKNEFLQISKKFGKNEFITLAKFILIAGIILPNLPDKQIVPFLTLSPYKMWLAIVVVSGISYFSYLMQKFVFTKSGIIVSGILGGLYSSTAVSIISSRKSQDKISSPNEYAASILFATAVMYIRVFLIALIIRQSIAMFLLPYLVLFFLLAAITGFILYKRKGKQSAANATDKPSQQNPLEFKVALLFAVLYILFSYVTHYVESHFGGSGLNLLSFLAGFADVDAYTINLVQGKFAVSDVFVVSSIIAATTSNNIMKGIYSILFAEKKTRNLVLIGFGIIILASLASVAYINLVN